jgi:uncharacterized repeat protein (TIGR03803 family)
MRKIILISTLFVTCLACFGQNYVLYGLTHSGGVNGIGTLFRYDIATGKDSVLLSFNGAGNGSVPYGNVVVNPNDGFLYGVTSGGGIHNDGVLFSYNPITGHDSVRVIFDSINGKIAEYGSLSLYNNTFYGMTLYGGQYNYGVLFGFDPVTNKDSTYISFDTNGQPYFPAGVSLTPYSNGLLYGMTYAGGAFNRGTIMSFNPITGLCSTVVSLDTNIGIYPIEGTLTLDKLNNLFYGLTYKGGVNNKGGIFCFNPGTGKDTLLAAFNGSNGSEPYGSLMYDTVNGLFYGMTSIGGSLAGGVMFSFDPVTFKDSTLFSFTGANGAVPLGDLILGPNNTLYGMTSYGGTSNLGVLFSYNTVTGKDSALFNFNGTNGSRAYGSLTLAQAPIVANSKDIKTSSTLAIYPNPCSSFTNLVFSDAGEHEVEINDIAGRIISSVNCYGKQYRLSLNGLAKGMYLIRYFNFQHTQCFVSKLLVQ